MGDIPPAATIHRWYNLDIERPETERDALVLSDARPASFPADRHALLS